MTVKRSVSFVLRSDDDPSLVLAVRRPPDDDDLPNAWGLPAGSLRGEESWQDAVRRAARDKLGVDVDVGRLLEEGEVERAGYTLRMRLFDTRVIRGEPHVPQCAPGVTQYTALDWAPADRFVPAADAGSLCCRLYLTHVERAADARSSES
jgi:ADP-ribose pyrophosphatase YjhB (NUDIX family)